MFLERLDRVAARIGDAIAVSLVADDGIPVESVSSSPISISSPSPPSSWRWRARSSKEQRELSVGDLRQLTIASERASFLLSRVSGRYWLLAALSPRASLGRARFEL
jgi:predicted regulator of Ras-like GTPase activity (Roadblock/LC7/MglB family)